MGHDITGLHHVGHIVRDMDEAIETYRSLGFTVSPPAYPVLPDTAPFGVANAHVYVGDAFVELVALIDEGLPTGARPIPLQVPQDRLPGLVAAIRATAANVADCLRRFEGVHILMFDTPDIDLAAARLKSAGVGFGGPHTIQRPVETPEGTRMERARYLEIDGPEPDLPPGRVREGRVGFAENAPSSAAPVDHANGATGLVECVLAVADAELATYAERYDTYVGRNKEAGIRLVAAPGQPSFVGYAVEVRDLDHTEQLLRANRVPFTRASPGEIRLSALGAAVTFLSRL